MKMEGWCLLEVNYLLQVDTGRAWMVTIRWRWKFMTVPRMSGQGKAPFLPYGSTTLPLLSSWTRQSGENHSWETKCDREYGTRPRLLLRKGTGYFLVSRFYTFFYIHLLVWTLFSYCIHLWDEPICPEIRIENSNYSCCIKKNEQ